MRNKRAIVSTTIALSFLVLSISGVLSYLFQYQRWVAAIHTVFGFVFVVGSLFHFRNNWTSIRMYFSNRGNHSFLTLLIVALAIIFTLSFTDSFPISNIMNWSAKSKANQKKSLENTSLIELKMDGKGNKRITVELLAGEHYWHPQMAIWTEDLQGNHLQSLFVSHATAKGTFFGGRTKENFKSFDESKAGNGEYRRVDALPVWSHSYGVIQSDGMFAPSNDNPVPDAITGATLSDNFRLETSFKSVGENKIRLMLEINVAFDDNEYFSEYDFPDDTVFHAGTGQLGQPSIVFEAVLDFERVDKKYYVMDIVGHGHHSGATGKIYTRTNHLTTAKKIVERVLVKVEDIVEESTGQLAENN